MPDPGAVVLEDLITVLALQAEHLVLVRDPDVLPQRTLVAATLPAVLAEVTLTCEIVQVVSFALDLKSRILYWNLVSLLRLSISRRVNCLSEVAC